MDKSIQTALANNNYEWVYFHPSEPMEKLKSIVGHFQPQLVLTVLGDHLSVQAVQYLKENGIKLACWMTEDPFYMDKTVHTSNRFDYIFTIDSGALKHYQSIHPNVYHLPLGTDPAIFKPDSVKDEYKSDLLLVGYPYPTRVSLVHFLLENIMCKITVIGRGWQYKLQRRWRTDSRVTIKNVWIEPQEVAHYYNGASIVLNPHRTHDFVHNQNKLGVVGESINNRTFDIGACEAFQLVEAKPDLYSFFTKEEMIGYHDYKDCLHKVVTYMNDEEGRKSISEKAREAVLAKHTFQHRVRQMIDIIQKGGS